MSVNRMRGRAIGRIACFLAGLAHLLCLLPPSYASADQFVSDDWTFQLAPYAWALAIDGDVTVKGQKSDIDVSFQDIWDELNVAAMLEGEARKGRVGAFANILYANLGSSSKKGPLEIDPDINLFLAGFGGYYRLGPYNLDATAGSDGPQLVVDAVSGQCQPPVRHHAYGTIEVAGMGPTRNCRGW
jgi:hypothetical protein